MSSILDSILASLKIVRGTLPVGTIVEYIDTATRAAYLGSLTVADTGKKYYDIDTGEELFWDRTTFALDQQLRKGSATNLPGTVGGADSVTTLLSAVLVTGAGSPVSFPSGRATFQAFVTGTTTGVDLAALVDIEVSNDSQHWEVLTTLALSAIGWNSTADDDHDSYECDKPWAFVRGNVTSISGTDAAVSLNFSN